MSYKIIQDTYARGMQALGSGRFTKKVKHQVCYIMCHEKGHPIYIKGQLLVYKSLWRAVAANVKKKYVIKKLNFDL